MATLVNKQTAYISTQQPGQIEKRMVTNKYYTEQIYININLTKVKCSPAHRCLQTYYDNNLKVFFHTYCSTVLTGYNMGLTCPSVTYGLITQKLKSIEKPQICMNVPEGRSNRCTNFSSKGHRSWLGLHSSLQMAAQYVGTGPTFLSLK